MDEKKILIVEDEFIIALDIEYTLRNMGMIRSIIF
jgi:hypothetical protein